MPSMIRLTTTDTSAVWDASFKQDVIIPEDAEIACYSMCCQINPTVLVVDNLNNEVFYSVNGAGDARGVYMTPGVFRSDNVTDLMTDLTYQLNRSMEYNELEIGKEWLVSTQGRFFTIECNRGQVSDMTLNGNLTGAVKVDTQDQGGYIGEIMFRDAPAGLVNDAFFYVKSPQAHGTSSIRAKLYKKGANPATESFIMGVVLNCPNQNTEEISIFNIVFGIKYDRFDGTYSYIENGKIIETDIQVNYTEEGGLLNDTICIDFENNTILAHVYRGDDETIELIGEFSNSYNHLTNLFPVYIFPGSSQWNYIEASTSYFYNVDNVYKQRQPRQNLASLPNMLTNQRLSQNYLQFTDPFLASFFGFKFARIPELGYLMKDNITYQSTSSFGLKDYSDSYIVQLLNLTLPESYDSESGQRVNFLDVIPAYSVTRDRVIYQSSNPIFLSLRNLNKINLRQIKARLLLENGTAPSTYGTSQLTILIRKRGEN